MARPGRALSGLNERACSELPWQPLSPLARGLQPGTASSEPERKVF